MTRTTIRIALFTQPDGTTRARSHIELKGAMPEAEAIDRARHIIRAKPLNHEDRGYLLNCLEIGNYELTTE